MISAFRFNWIDVIVVILFVRMGYVGYQRGLGAELAKLVGAVVGFFIGFRWYLGLGSFLAGWSFLSVEWSNALMMVVLVFLGYFLVTRAFLVVEKLVQISYQPKITKMGGLVAGLLRAGFVSSVVLVICQQLPSPYLAASIEERSLTGSRIARVAPAVYDAAKQLGSHLWAGVRPVP